MRPPITWVSHHVVYAQDLRDAWAVFRLPTRSYDSQPAAERASVVDDLVAMLTELQADGQIVTLGRPWNPTQYLEGRRRLASPVPALRDEYVADQADAIDECAIHSRSPRAFLVVSLRGAAASGLRPADRVSVDGLRRLRDMWSSLGSTTSGVLSVEQRESDQRDAQRLLAQLRGYRTLADIRPATTNEIQWWLRAVWARGLEDEVEIDVEDAPQSLIFERNGKAMLRPVDMDLVRWTGGIQSSARWPDFVVVSDGDGRRVLQQTQFATRLHGKAEDSSPSLALALRARLTLPWPVDLSIRWDWIGNEESERRITKLGKRLVNDAAEEAASDDGASAQAKAAPVAAEELRQRLGAGDEPTLRASVALTIAVPVEGDDGMEEAIRTLRARSAETRRVVERYCDVRFAVPPMQQLQAFYAASLPGQRSSLPGYLRTMLPDQVATQGWTAADRVGSSTGWLLGRTVSQRPQPVHLDPRDGSRTNRASGILLAGDLGSGKTATTSKIMLEAALEGAQVIDDDPKGDHTWWQLLPPSMVQHVVLQATDSSQRGLLDPWICAPPSLRRTVAESFLRALMPPHASERSHNRLSRAISDVAALAEDGTRVTNSDVIRALRVAGDPDAIEVAEGLEARLSGGLAALGFASGETATDLGSRPVTVLVTSQLPRPDASRSRGEYTDAERIGEEIMGLIAQLAYAVMARHRATLKIYNSDEGWRTLRTQAGRDLMAAMQRLGRSELVVPMIGTQLASDISGEDSERAVENLFGARLLFRQADAEQAERALTLCGLDRDPRMVDRLTSIGSGRCLLVDHARRTGWIDVVLPRILREVTSTTPDTSEQVERLASV